MSIIGSRLAHYEITSHLGSGGMGEVYQATDTKLRRSVAVKILPDAFTHDADRLARFEREARVLASLNHPHIAAIYGLEESNGRRLLIMELVEGETLADRIERGSIPANEALPIAKQIADALEAAHEKGIIHRDLKPANIKISPEGNLKVLDFGLAKALDTDSSAGAVSVSPTLSMAATNAGVILGTAAYMSPEQARGRAIDKRSDIWAFGCVLYEMLTGQRAFEGEDVGQTLATVIMKEPDLDRVPENVRPLIRSCLEKDPKKRLRDIGDAWRLFDGPASVAEAQSRRRQASFLPWALAGAFAAIALVAGVLAWRVAHPAAPPLKPLVRLNVDLGPDVALGSLNGADAVLSPDGTRLVYVSANRLFMRRLDQPEPIELAPGHVDPAFAPSFSSDGAWVAFFSRGSLNKVSIEGGAAIRLCDAPSPNGSSWTEDGNIVASLTFPGGLSLIPGAGGQPVPLTQLEPGEVTHRWPQVLPGGKAVLFISHVTPQAYDAATIEIVTVADHRRKVLQRGGTFARYVPSGHLVYVSRGTLFAVAFDLAALEVRGTPVPVLEEVAYSALSGAAQVDVSQAGTLVYRVAGQTGRTFEWLEASGRTQPLLTKPDVYQWPSLSPDGRRLALSMADVWVYEWQRDTMTRLTFDGGNYPVWSPDGQTIAYRKLGEGIFLIRSDGAGKPQPLVQTKNLPAAWSFSPDGKRLAFQDTGATGYDLWTVAIDEGAAGGPAKPEILLQTPFNERWPSVSPDGRWLAYGSDESGSYQVYVRAFPDRGGKWQVSSAGGVYPEWSPTARELFFRSDDDRIMVASYTVRGDSFVADRPRVWSETRLADTGLNGRPFNVAPDGKRVVALMPLASEGQQAQNHVMFVQNFFDELLRRVPATR